jgi:hypothetical protein
LTSKPTWSNTCRCSATSAFFVLDDNNKEGFRDQEWTRIDA